MWRLRVKAPLGGIFAIKGKNGIRAGGIYGDHFFLKMRDDILAHLDALWE